MKQAAFANWVAIWGCWTYIELALIAVCWRTRSRVLGKWVYRVESVACIRRDVRERRVEKLSEALERQGVAEEGRPDKGKLVDRWHRMVVGRWVSVCWQLPPLLMAAFPVWRTSPIRETVRPSVGVVAALLVFCIVPIVLAVADQRAVTVSDPAGEVTDEAVHFLELLLVPERRSAHGSALAVHHGSFSRLCRALRVQARHRTRGMSSTVRVQVRDITERLIAALSDADRRYLFSEGVEREAAVRDLSCLVASALRHSCRPLSERDNLMVVDPRLLVDTPPPDPATPTTEPLLRRLVVGAGRLTVAAGLFAGAYVLLGESVASGLLGTAGLVMFASVYQPLRDALPRVTELFSVGAQQAPGEESIPSVPAQRSDDASATADTR